MRSASSNNIPPRVAKVDLLSKAECLAVVIPQSACTATDLDCICNNQALTESTTACLVSNCTVKEALCMGSAPNVFILISHADGSFSNGKVPEGYLQRTYAGPNRPYCQSQLPSSIYRCVYCSVPHLCTFAVGSRRRVLVG